MIPEAAFATIAAAGDVFPGDHYFSLGHGLMSRTENGQLLNLFSDFAPVLRACDIALCNLEGPLSRSSHHRNRVQAAAFRGLPQFSQLLRDAGFTHINVANNHVAQHGGEALEETIGALTERGLEIVGLSGQHIQQISQPVVCSIRERSTCIVGYSAVPERHAHPPLRYAYFSDPAPVAAEIASLSRQYDDVIVSCHAGDEGLSRPSPAVVSIFRSFIDAGARCVLGHHPHIFQPVERYRDGLVAYSLGNFAFDLLWDVNAVTSALLVLTMTAADIGSELIPTQFCPDYRIRKASPSRARALQRSLAEAATLLDSADDHRYAIALNNHERHSRYPKFAYFLRNLARGNTRGKLEFLLSKVLP